MRLALILTGLMFCTGAAASPIQFEDVTSGAGVGARTETWGASWGDFNGDGWPDNLEAWRITKVAGTGDAAGEAPMPQAQDIPADTEVNDDLPF